MVYTIHIVGLCPKLINEWNKWKNHFSEMKGMSPHEKEKNKMMPTQRQKVIQPHPGFSPEHLGVRAPYALHYEPYALILALRFIYVALRVVRVWYVRKKSAYACVIHNTTCNPQLQCGTKWFSNWKASLLCWASRGFPNRKLLGLINF